MAELAEASVDADWLRAVAGLLETKPADGREAALRLRIFRRAESALAAARVAETAAVAAFAEQAAENAECVAYPDLEVAVALNVGEGTARAHVSRARIIDQRLPETLARMRAGHITDYHAIRLTELAIDERREQLLGESESEIWAKLDAAGNGRPTVPELMRVARRVMARRDSKAFERTHEQARRKADVRMRAESGTAMAYLSAYLPVVDAATVVAAVGAHAAALKASGDDRPVGELRADGLRAFADRYLMGTGPTGATGRPTVHGRPVEVQVVATADTVLGLADDPGDLPGDGPVPASVIRDLAREAAVRLLTIDDDSGRVLDVGRSTYRAPAEMAAAVKARYPLSGAPGCDTAAVRVDLDHREPFGSGGPTKADNLTPLPRRWHGGKTNGGFRYTVDPASGQVVWTTLLTAGPQRALRLPAGPLNLLPFRGER